MITFIWRPRKCVLFMDESQISLYIAVDRRRVWRQWGEQYVDVNVVDRVALGCGGVNTFENAHRYND